jgi:ergothioneine biosynthesis protein EgtB
MSRPATLATDAAEHERAALLRVRLLAARARTDELFAGLVPAAFLERPIAERHRLIFYLGHLEVFDFNLLARGCCGRPATNAAWERLFAFGIDPLDGGLPVEGPDAWPHVDDVRRWLPSLRAAVDRAIGEAPFEGWLAGGWALRAAIEHREMHAETLAYLWHRLRPELMRAGPLPADVDRQAPANEPIAIPAGEATLGLERAREPVLGWDNEYEAHRIAVPAFRIDRHPTTNADWLEFVDAGGYGARELWNDADWRWRQHAGVEHPAFWRRRDGRWYWRTRYGEVPLPPAWPVFVSHAEASAYARWRGRRLPTEAQWHRAALGTPSGREHAYPWGDAPPVPGVHGNFGFARTDPTAVDAHPAGRSAFGVDGLVGNGWQWTQTVFAPFAGFAPAPFYRGYSADFFDGRHFVLKGGSQATATGLLRRSFRNWFQPHYPYVFATFRCVEE